MAPTITIATHNMGTQIEYEPLPWYLDSAVINPDTGDILQYKYLIQLKKINKRPLEKRIVKILWATWR